MKPQGWPKLRGYQKSAALDLSTGRKVGLIVAAGLGKTAIVLSALHMREVPLPWLFVTRAIGRHAFVRDAAWVLGPDLIPGILWGGKAYNATGAHEDGTYSSLTLCLSENPSVVTNYDILDRRSSELLEVPWGAMIFDESHAIKGGYQRPAKRLDGSIVRTRYHWAKELAAKARKRGGVVWEMTATAIRDRRRDLWSQLDLATGGAVLPGPDTPLRSVGWRHLEEINRARLARNLPKLTMSALYTTIDGDVCFPGPFGVPLIYPELDVEQGAATCFLRRYCDAHQGQYGLDTLGESSRAELTKELEWRLGHYFVKLTRAEVASELPAVQQIAEIIDPVKSYVPKQYRGGGLEEAIARAGWYKIPHVLEMLEEHVTQGERVVIACTRRRLARELHKKIEEAAAKYPPAIRRSIEIDVLTGDVEIRRRVARLKAFNEGKGPGVLVATMDCMSESVDLHYIPIVIVVTLPYTPGQVDQFQGRFARLGGIPVTIYYLIADGTIDVHIKEQLRGKLEDVVRIGVDTAAAATTEETLRELYDDERIIEELKAALRAMPEFEED